MDTCPVGDGCHRSKWNDIGQLTIWRRVLLGVARGGRAIGMRLFHLVSGGSRPLSELQGKDEISNHQAWDRPGITKGRNPASARLMRSHSASDITNRCTGRLPAGGARELDAIVLPKPYPHMDIYMAKE